MKYKEIVGIVHGSIGEVLASVDVHPNLTLNVSIDHSFRDDHVKIAIGDVQLTGMWKCELIASENAVDTSEKMPQPTIIVVAKPAITATSKAVAIRSDFARVTWLSFDDSSWNDLGHEFLIMNAHFSFSLWYCCVFEFPIFFFFYMYVHDVHVLLWHTGLTISISSTNAVSRAKPYFSLDKSNCRRTSQGTRPANSRR